MVFIKRTLINLKTRCTTQVMPLCQRWIQMALPNFLSIYIPIYDKTHDKSSVKKLFNNNTFPPLLDSQRKLPFIRETETQRVQSQSLIHSISSIFVRNKKFPSVAVNCLQRTNSMRGVWFVSRFFPDATEGEILRNLRTLIL